MSDIASPGCDKRCYGATRCAVGWPDGSCGGAPQGERSPPPLTATSWEFARDPLAMLSLMAGRKLGNMVDRNMLGLPRMSQRQARLFVCACYRVIWERESHVTRYAVELAENHADEPSKYVLPPREDIVCLRDAFAAARRMLEWARDVASDPSHNHNPENVALSARFADMLREILGNPFQPPLFGTRPCPLCHGKGGWANQQGRWLIDLHCGGTGELPVPWQHPARVLAAALTSIDAWDRMGGEEVADQILALYRHNDLLVPRLAQTIYDESDWTLLPMLADALEEAGCANRAMMAHCRQQRCSCSFAHPPHDTCDGVGGPLHVKGCWVLDTILGRS